MKGTESPPGDEVDGIAAFLRAEDVPPGARLLDVPCGIGRRAMELAKTGYHVVAIDANEVGIAAAAKRVPQELRPHLSFAVAPRERLPGLPIEQTFHAILCLDHALGRGAPDDDIDLLRRLAVHAKAETPLVLDLLNRDYLAARPRPFAVHVLGNMEQHEFRRFDPVAGVVHFESKFYERSGEDLKHRTTSDMDLRLFPPDAIREMLTRAGWRVDAFYGDWDRTNVGEHHRKFIVVARPTRS